MSRFGPAAPGRHKQVITTAIGRTAMKPNLSKTHLAAGAHACHQTC